MVGVGHGEGWPRLVQQDKPRVPNEAQLIKPLKLNHSGTWHVDISA